MSVVMIVTIAFTSGLFAGVGVVSLISMWAYKRHVKKEDEMRQKFKDMVKKEGEKLKKQLEDSTGLKEEIVDRLQEASQISQKQGEIAASLEIPSSNALHSKHKMQLIAEWKALEEEKLATLQSILNDGFDPTITVADGDGLREVALSEFVMSERNNSPFEDEESNEILKDISKKDKKPSIKKITKNGKTFFMIQREDDDTVH